VNDGPTATAAVSDEVSRPRAGRIQLQELVLLQLEDVVPQQLDVLQLQVLEQLQLHEEVAATSWERSTRSRTSKVSHSR
jgi:hypothetical protein